MNVFLTLIIILTPAVFALGAFLGNKRKGKESGWALGILCVMGIMGFGAMMYGGMDTRLGDVEVPLLKYGGMAGMMLSAFVFGWLFPMKTWYNRFELWFARRITTKGQRAMSGLVVKLGLVSIALGVAVMQVAVSIVFGFEGEIQNKVVGFAGHIHVGNLYEEYENEKKPLPRNNQWVEAVKDLPFVKNIQPYAQKPAILRSDLTQEGVFLKGVDSTFNFDFFEGYLIDGKLPDVNNGKNESKEILISKKLSDVLDIAVDGSLVAYFYEDRLRVRKLKVAGIYETGLEEFDQVRVICDLRMIQRIWRWEPNEVEAFEVNIASLDDLPAATTIINETIDPDYEARPVTQLFSEIFDWVELQHQNVWFILALMIIISMINMTSVILILILERTKTIGLLKALGMANKRVRRLFVINAMWLILIGMAIGNTLSMLLLWSQDTWGWLQVDQENYFINIVPVKWTWGWFFTINLGVFLVCTLFMYLPTRFATRISPVRILRFD